MDQKPFFYSLITLVAFFILLFAYTKLAGPIPFYITSVSTQKNSAFEVTGEGSVFSKPDVALVSAGISADAVSVKAAQDKINSTINKVSQSVKSLGVDPKDIKTSNYNINPTYDYNGGPQRIAGYSASTTLSIKVRQIEKVNSVIDAATSSGANQVGGVSFDIDDKTKAENDARTKAVEQAKQKAQMAAKIGGFSLGRLVNYSENFQGVPIYPRAMAVGSLSKDSAPQTQVEPGTNEVKVSVILSYEIR